MGYVVGVDFGTLSARAVVVDANDVHYALEGLR